MEDIFACAVCTGSFVGSRYKQLSGRYKRLRRHLPVLVQICGGRHSICRVEGTVSLGLDTVREWIYMSITGWEALCEDPFPHLPQGRSIILEGVGSSILVM